MIRLSRLLLVILAAVVALGLVGCASNSTATTSTTTPTPVSITTTSPMVGGTVGVAYSQTLAATGGTSPYTWKVTVGTLPAGLALSTAGVISGTPTAPAGTASYTVQATDSSTTPLTATLAATLGIGPVPIVITTTTLPAGFIGVAYTATLASTGGTAPITWKVTTGTLPAGLALSAAGVISGTPTAAGVSAITVTATDSTAAPLTATKTASLSITITVQPVSITTTTLPSGLVNVAYASTTLTAVGGTAPYTFKVTIGALPAGLVLSTAGVISGTPTAPGTINFQVTATDAATPAATGTATLSIAVTQVPVAITTTALPSGASSIAYAGATVVATGGIAPYTFAITAGSITDGTLAMSTAGVISGTPAAGVLRTLTFTVTATDSTTPTAQTGSASLSILINPTLGLTITTPGPALAAGTAGSAYAPTIAFTGGTGPFVCAISAGALPAGLSIAGVVSPCSFTGTLGGQTSIGTSNFTVQVTDSSGTPQVATAQYSVVVAPATLAFNSGAMPSDTVNTIYQTAAVSPSVTPTPIAVGLGVTGGTGPYTWSLTGGSLPTGLTLNTTTGVISGTPTSTNGGVPFAFAVKVVDSGVGTTGVFKQQTVGPTTFSITINSALAISTVTLASGQVGVALTDGLATTGGTGAVTFKATGLPADHSLAVAGATITGTPGPGDFNNNLPYSLVITASDSSPTPSTATVTLPLSIIPSVPTITTISANLAVGTAGIPYNTTLLATGGEPPYTWSLGAADTGALAAAHLSLNANGTITGTPTVAGTPAFVAVAKDSTPTQAGPPALAPQTSAPASLTATVLALGANNAALTGNYVFQLNGFDASGPVAVAGQFAATPGTGAISGVEDLNRAGSQLTNVAFTGTYAVGANNTGTLVITDTVSTYTFKLAVSASGGRMVQLDASGRNLSGIFKAQAAIPAQTAFNGLRYVFEFTGQDSTSKRLAIAGESTVSTSTPFTATTGEVDVNDGGTLSVAAATTGSLTLDTGTLTGRGTGTLVVGATTYTTAFYTVSAGDLFIVNNGTFATQGVFGGEALPQVASPTLVAGTAVIHTEAASGTGSNVQVGTLLFNGAGAIAASIDQNVAGTSSTVASGITYSAPDSFGRVTTNSGTGSVLYLFAPATNKALVLGVDAGVTAGSFEPQTAVVLPASTTLTLGSAAPVNISTVLVTGVETTNAGPTTLSTTTDVNGGGATPTLSGALLLNSTALANTAGRLTFTLTTPTGTDTYVGYPISTTNFVYIATGTNDKNQAVTVAGQ